MDWLLLTIIMIMTFAAADRLAGSSFGKSVPGSSDIWASALVVAMFTVLDVLFRVSPIWYGFAGTWIFWRAFGWKLGSLGGISPDTFTDAVALFIRHLLIFITVIPVYFLHGDIITACKYLILWVMWATSLGIINGLTKTGSYHPYNGWIEAARGAGFGFTLAKILSSLPITV